MKDDMSWHGKHWLALAGALGVEKMTADDLIKYLTIIFITLQLAHLLWKWSREWRGSKKRQAKEAKP